MTQRISRRDMKRNELAETVGKTVGYVTEHKKGVAEVVAIVRRPGRDRRGLLLYRAWTERSAGQDLSSRARGALDAAEVRRSPAAAKTFANAAERQAEADKFLRKAASPRIDRSGARRAGHPRGRRRRQSPPSRSRSSRRPPARASPRPRPPPRSTPLSLLASSGQVRRGHRPSEARDRLSVDGRPEGRPPLHARARSTSRAAPPADARADLPASDHRLSELSLSRRRAAESPAVLALLHGALVASAALAVICLVLLLPSTSSTMRRIGPARAAAAGDAAPACLVVVPARDEALGIEDAVRSHLAQDYPGLRSRRRGRPLHRRDGRDPRAAGRGGPAPRGRLRHRAAGGLARQAACPPPGGAAGHGRAPSLRRCRRALRPDRAFRRRSEMLERERLDLLALFPALEMEGFWENVLMPYLAVSYFFGPGFWINSDAAAPVRRGRRSRDARRQVAYRAAGGHEALRASVIDDIRLAIRVRRAGGRCRMAIADDRVRLRMYRGFREVFDGFTKNIALRSRVERRCLWRCPRSSLSPRGRFRPPCSSPAALGAAVPPRDVGLAGGRVRADRSRARALLGFYLNTRSGRQLTQPLTAAVWAAITVRSLTWRFLHRRLLWRGRTYDAGTRASESGLSHGRRVESRRAVSLRSRPQELWPEGGPAGRRPGSTIRARRSVSSGGTAPARRPSCGSPSAAKSRTAGSSSRRTPCASRRSTRRWRRISAEKLHDFVAGAFAAPARGRSRDAPAGARDGGGGHLGGRCTTGTTPSRTASRTRAATTWWPRSTRRSPASASTRPTSSGPSPSSRAARRTGRCSRAPSSRRPTSCSSTSRRTTSTSRPSSSSRSTSPAPAGAYLVVTHDRRFLDRVAEEIVDLENGRL